MQKLISCDRNSFELEAIEGISLPLNDSWLARQLRQSPELHAKFRTLGCSLRTFKRTSIGKALVEKRLCYLKTLLRRVGISHIREIHRSDSAHSNERLASLLCSIALATLQLEGPSYAGPFAEKAYELCPDDGTIAWNWQHIQTFNELEVASSPALNNLEPSACSTTPAESTTLRPICPKYTPIAVESAAELDIGRFRSQYARLHKPVVITGLRDEVASGPWTCEWLHELTGSSHVTLRKENVKSLQWARLDEAETVTLSHFLNERHAAFKDFISRLEDGSKYKDAWPSLFIGNRGVCSDLHIDAFGSSFWMYLAEGVKRWIIFPPEETGRLSPDLSEPGQLTFKIRPADLHPGSPSPTEVYASTHPFMCELQAGQVLFVPAGSPHTVLNLTDTIAVSGNFVDECNLSNALKALHIDGLVDPGARYVAEQLQQMAVGNLCSKHPKITSK
eukprot:gene9229-1513_t